MLDLVIIGAGPAGLMAARTAAGRGLSVALVEKRRDVSTITRACCQQLVMDPGYAGDTVSAEPGSISFRTGGFSVPYSGPLFPVTRKYYVSPGGRRICFDHNDGRPLAVQFDKGILLQGLWDACASAGVELIPGTTAWDAEESDTSITIKLTSNGNRSTITARKALLADGVNSRMAEALGMNKGRTHFVTTQCMVYTLEGVEDPEPQAMKSFMGNVYQSRAPIILYPYFDDPTRTRMCIARNKTELTAQVYAYARDKGSLAPYLKNARIVKEAGCGLRAYTSLLQPWLGNALAIGDAAAFVEVETQGALMCGVHAAEAVKTELEDRTGFERYTQWWQQAFEFNGPDALRVAQGYALTPTYTDDELDCLFGLIEDETLPGSYSQYNTPRYMWDAILRHKNIIASLWPGLLEKINRNMQRTLNDTL
jgi:digeranylgeranylglycerophospholipid reductase